VDTGGENYVLLLPWMQLLRRFFFCWHYSPRWTLASFKIVLHCSRSCVLRLQFFTPIFLRSVSTDSSHLPLSFPTRRVPSGLYNVSFLQGSNSCILKRCPSHLSLRHSDCPVYCTACKAHYCILFSRYRTH
jgi:hypothetical protein